MTRRISVVSFLAVGLLAGLFIWATQSARGQNAPVGPRITIRLPVPALTQIALKEAVQKELGIERSDPWIPQIDQLRRKRAEEQDRRAESILNQGAGISADQMREIALDVQARYDAKLTELLTAAQFKRLKQIAWQLAEPRAVAQDPELVQALGITKDQETKLKALFRGTGRPMPGTARPPRQPLSETELSAKRRESLAEQQKKVDAILSKTQQEKLAELKGKPIDLELFRHSFLWNGKDRTPDPYHD